MNMPSTSSGLSIQIISRLSEIFARHEKVSSVVLYGSRAKGNWRNESDIDLTIHADGLEWSEFQKIEREIDDLLFPWKMDLSLYDHIENQELREHIERVGKVFYQRCVEEEGSLTQCLTLFDPERHAGEVMRTEALGAEKS